MRRSFTPRRVKPRDSACWRISPGFEHAAPPHSLAPIVAVRPFTSDCACGRPRCGGPRPQQVNLGRCRLANRVCMWHIASFRKCCCGKDKGVLSMQIWPAIDLRGGKCVRLRQGDYCQETVFGDDPAAMACRWMELGAKQLHLVDLDGARDGILANRAAVAAILARLIFLVSWAAGFAMRRRSPNCSAWDYNGWSLERRRSSGRLGFATCARSFPAGWSWGSMPAMDTWPRTDG